ncbi:thioesterase II family protein [Enterovibrio norvegicus]|uniref:thioesterase II family protein n=1 Tax=Enterovibrio norvegicus TaxID=188144 RepID=UPI00352EE277
MNNVKQLNAQRGSKTGVKTPWFRVIKTGESIRQRIFCLPHAGGSAGYFRQWRDAVPAHTELIAVQYPGREERLNHLCIDNMEDMVSALFTQFLENPSLLREPFVIFGHSMGASIAYELTLKLLDAGFKLPKTLIASATDAPGHANPTHFHISSDGSLIQEIVRLNPSLSFLQEHEDLLQMILPSLRADYKLIESYGKRNAKRPPLPLPIIKLIGEDDDELSRKDALLWRNQTSTAFSLRVFQGGHFYLAEHYQGVMRTIMEAFDDNVVFPPTTPYHLP